MQQAANTVACAYIGKLLGEHADAGAVGADDEPMEARLDGEVARGLVLEPLDEHLELLDCSLHAVARPVDEHLAELLRGGGGRRLLRRLLLAALLAGGRRRARHRLLADRYVTARLGADPLHCEPNGMPDIQKQHCTSYEYSYMC